MSRKIHRLNARRVASLAEIGRHADGQNLFLVVSPTGSRSWKFKYERGGRVRELGLGSARDVPLARAREIAAAHRARLAEGLEPEARRHAAGALTFGKMADQTVASLRGGWRNAKHARQWITTLRVHAASLWNLPVDKVTTEDVLDVLKPIWTDQHETATRVRQRIEKVLDRAKALGLRTGENPARWRGHLDHLLSQPPRLERKHLKAMPYSELPAFMERLRAESCVSARALEFAILTGCRTGEVLGARRQEFLLASKLWTIPKERMKAGRSHSIPLSDRAAEIVAAQPIGAFVFAGAEVGTQLNKDALLQLLRRMEIATTVHGFRSTFREWTGDQTNFPREIAEAALAHVVGNTTEQSYRRGSALEKRRELMDQWARYLTGEKDTYKEGAYQLQ
jgi:integrase